MPKIKVYILLLFFTTLVLKIDAQNRKRDSLSHLIRTSHDTTKVKILVSLSRMLEANNPDSALIIGDSALKIAKKNNFQIGIGMAYNSVGSSLTTAGKYDLAINNLIKGLQVFEKLKLKGAITNNYNSLANAYMGLKDNVKAKDYFLKAYNISSEEPRNESMIAVTSVGVGNMLLEELKFKEAIKYYQQAEKYFKEKNIKNYEAMATTMIGETFLRDSNFVEAEKYFLKVIPIFREINDEYGLATALLNIGNVEMEKKDYNKAGIYLLESLELNKKRKANDNIQSVALILSQLMEKKNKPVEALNYYKIYMQYKDSVINIERNRSIAESESKYESEKKEQQLKVKNLELEKSQIQSSQRGMMVYIFAGALLIFIILLFFVFKQFSEKKKANVLLTNKNIEIEKQKSIIEEKNKDITDSINYSKHIQQAIIPSTIKVKSTLNESLIVFKPKDIVSGDFYFVEKIDDSIYVAVIDCTGHGVPGALLSVFAYSNIKNIISSGTYRSNPAGILTELCKQFKSNLQSHTIKINDGVDMSICILNTETKKIYYSGAKNNMLQVNDAGLKEYLADRWGVSGANEEKQTVFTNYEIEAKEGEKYFLFTDGFADQFGGPKGKKFKLKQLEELLLRTHNMPFEQQSFTLSQTFVDWKGNLEQIDDVTIIGFGI
ncbi:MAG: SpoIIE family protein phosphatase [Bacteroidetes bacterium]|nr:SpoIIE family protein phosphatase [Bacteroidota bacterium]